MKLNVFLMTLLLVPFLSGAARAENATPKPIAAGPTVTLLTATGVLASVTFQGDYGPTRIEGTLISLPDEPIRAQEGKLVTEIPLRHLQELERTPLGVGADALSTYSLQLFTGESYLLQPQKSEPPNGPQPAAVTRTMQVVSVPKGNVEVKTALFGVLRVPFPKLLQLTVEPIRGTVRALPAISLPVQVMPGLTLPVPFGRLTSFHRDPMGGTTTISFGNAEGATGRVAQMPEGLLVIRTIEGEERRIPLSELVQYNVESPLELAAGGTKNQ